MKIIGNMQEIDLTPREIAKEMHPHKILTSLFPPKKPKIFCQFLNSYHLGINTQHH